MNGLDEVTEMSIKVTFPVIHSIGDKIADTGSFSQAVALVHFVFDTEELKNTIGVIYEKYPSWIRTENQWLFGCLKV